LSDSPIFLGRLAILPFAPLLWLVVWLSLRYRPHFLQNSIMRMAAALVVGMSLVAIFLIQIRLYGSITQAQPVADDNFVLAVLLGQSLVGIAMILWLVLSRRKKNSETFSRK